jgi:hypothetical protein
LKKALLQNPFNMMQYDKQSFLIQMGYLLKRELANIILLSTFHDGTIPFVT